MSKKRIVIAGGGFAGTSALRRLAKHRRFLRKAGFEVTVIDKKDDFEFLPMLPDIIGGWLNPDSLKVSLADTADIHGAGFIKDEIREIDLENNNIKFARGGLAYDYIIIATGSQTNFFGNGKLEKDCFKVDDVADAVALKQKVLERAGSPGRFNIVIVGGGYAGIEIATNTAFLLKKRGIKYHISIVEKADDILMMVPDSIRKEVGKELFGLGIELIYGDSVKAYDGQRCSLGSGAEIKDALCVWVAGVRTPRFLENMAVEKEKTRIKAGESLLIKGSRYRNAFLAGDTASFAGDNGAPIRMAVMFAMGQGKIAAQNVINSILNRPLVRYHPADLGYLIPMAHGRASGFVMGNRIRGSLGYVMHYIMCIYRSSRKNKAGIIRDLFVKAYK